MFSTGNISHYNGVLRTKGYDVNNVEEIKRATKDDESTIRIKAMYLLAYQIGSESIPTIKDALDDYRPIVRCDAARLLSMLGDRSGLEVMRRDMAEFTREDWKEEEAKDEFGMFRRDIPFDLQTKDGRLLRALRAAEVLAECGDVSGYNLAAKSVFDGIPLHRHVAINTLSEIGRLDEAKLKEKGCNPEAILLLVSEKETDHRILRFLIDNVLTNMRPEPKIRILEKVQSSPYLTDEQKRIVQGGLKTARKLLEKEKQSRTENKK